VAAFAGLTAGAHSERRQSILGDQLDAGRQRGLRRPRRAQEPRRRRRRRADDERVRPTRARARGPRARRGATESATARGDGPGCPETGLAAGTVQRRSRGRWTSSD
jgi:hypothetical protein